MGDRWTLVVTMRDGSEWTYSVMAIARDRARNYADEFGGDVERSLSEDTIPLFRESEFEIVDWAANNMNEDQITGFQSKPAPVLTDQDRQEGWVNGPKRIEHGVRA